MPMSKHVVHERGTLMDHFHRERQAGQHGSAAACLERALQTPQYRPEALVWKGIEALQEQCPQDAFIYLANAADALPERADIRALIGRSILAQQQYEPAARQLHAAWQQMPADPALRIMLWQARSKTEKPENLRKQILARLPEITDAKELNLVLNLLAAQKDASGTLGVVSYQPESGEIQGWAINLKAPGLVADLQIHVGGQSIQCTADQPHPLLAQAGLPATHGGIRKQVNATVAIIHVHFADGTPLLGSPLSNLPAFTAPAPRLAGKSHQEPVDILVPVYDGHEETLECLNSVLLSRSQNRTAHRVVVLDDATPNPQLRLALLAMAKAGDIEHIINPANLGFIRNVNRGMALSPERDVVWLNADTRVHGNWLDRLRAVAYSDKSIASVTPFTNNGELMSFPASRFSHDMPSADEQAHLDNLASLTASPAMEIETGCGFCLYIKRSAINEVGYLDEVHLLRGYGEETDWCLRARTHGWKHMGAPTVFVAHQGGASFGDEKSIRVAHNNAILMRRYPDASARYSAFCLSDPIKPARQALQRARLTQLAEAIDANPAMQTLHLHDGQAAQTPLSLVWRHARQRTRVTLHAGLPCLALDLDYELPADNERLLQDLQALPLTELLYQSQDRCPHVLLGLPAQLDKPYRLICRDDALLDQKQACAWQAFARQAASIQLPWKSLHRRYAAAFPDARLVIENRRCPTHALKTAPRVLLIADVLDERLGPQWLELARRIARKQLPMLLLMPGDSPWLAPLQATGTVYALPHMQGLEMIDCVRLAGCKAALSLESSPGASWRAPLLTEALELVLYAPHSAVANEAGAVPIKHLPI